MIIMQETTEYPLGTKPSSGPSILASLSRNILTRISRSMHASYTDAGVATNGEPVTVLTYDINQEFKEAFSPVYAGAVIGREDQNEIFFEDLTKKTGIKTQEFTYDPTFDIDLPHQLIEFLRINGSSFAGKDFVIHVKGLYKYFNKAKSHSMGHFLIQDVSINEDQRKILKRFGKKLLVIFSVESSDKDTQKQLLGAQYLKSSTAIV